MSQLTINLNGKFQAKEKSYNDQIQQLNIQINSVS